MDNFKNLEETASSMMTNVHTGIIIAIVLVIGMVLLGAVIAFIKSKKAEKEEEENKEGEGKNLIVRVVAVVVLIVVAGVGIIMINSVSGLFGGSGDVSPRPSGVEIFKIVD